MTCTPSWSPAMTLCFPTAPTNIHPLFRFGLYHLHLLIDQLHQRCAGSIFPQHLIPDLQQQLVDVQLDRACAYTPLHDFGWEVVRSVQRNQYALVDLLVDSFEAVEVNLPFRGTRRPVVAVDVTD